MNIILISTPKPFPKALLLSYNLFYSLLLLGPCKRPQIALWLFPLIVRKNCERPWNGQKDYWVSIQWIAGYHLADSSGLSCFTGVCVFHCFWLNCFANINCRKHTVVMQRILVQKEKNEFCLVDMQLICTPWKRLPGLHRLANLFQHFWLLLYLPVLWIPLGASCNVLLPSWLVNELINGHMFILY